MGLYEVSSLLFLFGFGMGMMLVSFHVCGMRLVLRVSVYNSVRWTSPRGVLGIRYWIYQTLFSWFYCVLLFVLHVVCSIVLLNCLLNAFVICLGVVVVLLLNIMMMFCIWVVLWLPSMGLHSVGVFRCFMHFSFLFVSCCSLVHWQLTPISIFTLWRSRFDSTSPARLSSSCISHLS